MIYSRVTDVESGLGARVRIVGEMEDFESLVVLHVESWGSYAGLVLVKLIEVTSRADRRFSATSTFYVQSSIQTWGHQLLDSPRANPRNAQVIDRRRKKCILTIQAPQRGPTAESYSYDR